MAIFAASRQIVSRVCLLESLSEGYYDAEGGN